MTWTELVTLCLLVTFSVQFSYSPNRITDECDWSGSGVARGFHQRSIRPVYLRCAQGRVEWKYPRGGLRVVLRHGTSGKEFKGCLRAGHHFEGARVYVEGHRTLHLLYSPDDGRHPQLPRCFTSHGGQVALFVEAVNVMGSKGVVEFLYDLQPWRSRGDIVSDTSAEYHHHHIQQDCQPCSEADLLQLYCTSDFVVQGRMVKMHNNVPLERTEVTVEAVRILKENSGMLFKPKKRTWKQGVDEKGGVILPTSHHHNYYRQKHNYQQHLRRRHHHQQQQQHQHHLHQHHNNSTNGSRVTPQSNFDKKTRQEEGATTKTTATTTSMLSWTGVVHLALECDAQLGAGQFLFLGRLFFGDPYVSCAPRYEDWDRVWNKAASQGLLKCH